MSLTLAARGSAFHEPSGTSACIATRERGKKKKEPRGVLFNYYSRPFFFAPSSRRSEWFPRETSFKSAPGFRCRKSAPQDARIIPSRSDSRPAAASARAKEKKKRRKNKIKRASQPAGFLVVYAAATLCCALFLVRFFALPLSAQTAARRKEKQSHKDNNPKQFFSLSSPPSPPRRPQPDAAV